MMDPRDHTEQRETMGIADEQAHEDTKDPQPESKRRDEDLSSDDNDEDCNLAHAAAAPEATSAIGSGSIDELAHLRKEKRLAMNRASARERRRRKKVLIETLEDQLEELTKRNRILQAENEQFQAQVQQLEGKLAQARALVSKLESPSFPKPALPTLNLPNALALAAQHDNLRNVLLAAGTPDGGALHQTAAFLPPLGVHSIPPAASVAGILGCPGILGDVLTQREILRAQVISEQHRRAAILENATLNRLHHTQHSQVGLGEILGHTTTLPTTDSMGIYRVMAEPGNMLASRKADSEGLTLLSGQTAGASGSDPSSSIEPEEKVTKKKAGNRYAPRQASGR